jgi:integrase
MSLVFDFVDHNETPRINPTLRSAHSVNLAEDLLRRTLFLVAATGLRVSEFLALRWRHVLWDESKISIEQVFRRGEILKRTKTTASKAPVPMCEVLAKTLSESRQQTEYSKDEDLVFASPTLTA